MKKTFKFGGFMAEGNESSNTVIIAIVLLAAILLGLLYFYGTNRNEEEVPATETIIETPEVEIDVIPDEGTTTPPAP
jgi:hypothetical protein